MIKQSNPKRHPKTERNAGSGGQSYWMRNLAASPSMSADAVVRRLLDGEIRRISWPWALCCTSTLMSRGRPDEPTKQANEEDAGNEKTL